MRQQQKESSVSKRLSDVEIAARIVPTFVRWPALDVAKSIGWGRLRDCVDALRGLIRTAEDHCIAAEQDQDLSREGIIRRRTQIGLQALNELKDFEPLKRAEQAVAN